MVMAELNSRYLTQDLKNDLSKNARACIQRLLLQMMPASTHLSPFPFDFFGWHKRDQGDATAHGVKFLVPASRMDEVLFGFGDRPAGFLASFRRKPIPGKAELLTAMAERQELC